METIKCSLCKYWSRSKLYKASEQGELSSVGMCSLLDGYDNDSYYYDDPEVAQEKVKPGKIGCENLYTHEDFGCIHFVKP